MARQTRREFLENSMFAAAAAGVSAAALTPAAYSDDEKPAGPNDVLRVAVLGVRSRGQSHLNDFMKLKGCEVTAVVDPDEGVAQSKGVDHVAKTTGKKPKAYKDMRSAFDDPNIDIVTIATPNHWHALAAIWAVQAGKDVYVEKPVSHNVSEGRRIVQAARKHERVVQTGTQCRSMKGTIDAVQYVHDGKIGNVKLARGLCYKRRKSIGPRGKYDVPAGVDYNLWTGPAELTDLTRPRFHYDWHWQWNTGNGDLGNQGIHQMDVARWGLGVNDLGRSVLSYGGRFGYEDAGETANTQVCQFDYGDKQLVFEVRGLPTSTLRGANVGVIFQGAEGYVVLTSYTRGAAFDLDGKKVKDFDGDGNHAANFVQAVRSRDASDLTADIEEGHLSSALCHIGNISYKLGKPLLAGAIEERLSGLANSDEATATFERVAEHLTTNGVDLAKTKVRYGAALKLDPKAETFTGESAEQANALLTRNYRKPFIVPSEKDV